MIVSIFRGWPSAFAMQAASRLSHFDEEIPDETVSM